MSYFDNVYKKRVALWGTTQKEQHLTLSKKYFDNYLLNSPNRETITYGGSTMDAVILDNSEDANKVTKYLLLPLGTQVGVASVITWKDINWILLRKHLFAYEAYDKYLMINASHTIKWVDSYGIVKTSPAFLRGSLESQLSYGMKVSQELIIPVPNKGLIGILPVGNIANGQRVLIGDQAWEVVERDLISTNGLMYVSFIETTVDVARDNVAADLANADSVNKYIVDAGFLTAKLLEGETLALNPKLFIDGIETDASFVLLVPANDFVSVAGMNVTGLSTGSANVKIALSNNPEVFTTIGITVEAIPTTEAISFKLLGDESIKWGRSRTYTLIRYTNGTPSDESATFTIDNSSLATIVSYDANSCTIKANDKLVGKIILTATYSTGTIEKEISIQNIWG